MFFTPFNIFELIYFCGILNSSCEQKEIPSASLYVDRGFIELKNKTKSLDFLNTN